MNYKEKYNKALERAKYALTTDMDNSGHWAVNYIFPELKEDSNDPEKIRKALKQGFFEYGNSFKTFGGITVGDIIAWLEDQDKTDKSLYIRFGDIPINGKSKVYNGEIETGIEEGISVYPAFEDKEGNVILGLNLPITKTSLHTQQHLLEYDSRPCYLVTGDCVGKGTDGEPLLKNVRIIKEIKPYRIKQDKENNAYIINNTPNCGISVSYNEELKESKDEREELILYLKGNLKGTRFTTVEGAEQVKNWIAWLEKQKEKPQGKSALEAIKEEKVDNQNCVKSIDKVESKFHEGEWITDGHLICKVLGVTDKSYELHLYNDDYCHFETDKQRVNKYYHLWTINDAKDGDVLAYVTDEEDLWIMIYRSLYEPYEGHVHYHALLVNDNFSDKGTCCICIDNLKPATKEQRDLLFQKMKQEGYELNSDNPKELKKMEETNKENKDEEIRKALIDYFDDANKSDENSLQSYGIQNHEAIAWLENQKEFVSADFDDVWETADCDELTAPLEKYSKDAIKKMCHAWYDKGIELEKRNWLENQGNVDKVSYEIAEKEKYDFVSGQFIECRKSFNEFKELNSYWFEYVGNDTYIGRSDNILNQKFHITPMQLYRLFTQQHCPKEDNINKETNAPTAYGKYVDECLNEAAKHFFSEGEDTYSVADLFYAGVRCGKSWLEKQNPAWSEKDKNLLNRLIGVLDGTNKEDYHEAWEETFLPWLKSLKERMQPQPKQCEQSTDEIKTKFNEGDYIVPNNITSLEIWKVINIDEDDYYNIQFITNSKDDEIYRVPTFIIEEDYHLWTINDAKDGDVLVNGSNIFIFHFINGTRLMGYCHVNLDDGRFYDDIGKNECFCLIDAEVTPASKEQRNLLFTKMKEDEYEWNTENKKLTYLKKLSKQTLQITPKFCVGQVITDDNGTWYKIKNIKCLEYYELYDACEDTTHLELCSIIDEKFRENRFVSEIKKMMGD